ncbi:rRNA adenine N-6-methyltransferase family protein [Microlunatus sp. GCM10028923]|uniref:rRNA adenine N-6-methyltransferase family protein n=1 Tax=Microlunatus sp. GCM10028923 TaxID=3273400 RepID=UPI00361488BA
MPARPFPLDPDLDQHLLDPRLAADLVAGAEILPDDVVLDVGAGTGALTGAILRHRPRSVIAVEPDPRCLAALGGLPGVDLRSARIQDLDPAELDAVTRIIANPPFSALHHVIGLARRLPRLRAADLCVGRRWAAAATAMPADPYYSVITLDVTARFSVAVRRTVPGSAFTPAIAGSAAWVRLLPLARPDPLLDLLAVAVREHSGLRLKQWLRSPPANRPPVRDRVRALRADPLVRALQQRRLSALTRPELAALVGCLQRC